MKIIIDDNIPYIKGRLEPVAEVVYADQFGFTPELVRDADALLIRTRTRCDEKLLSGSSVRLVATATIGMDQIDTAWCRAHGIKVSNSPGCNAPAVAQYVWASLLRSGFRPGKDTLGIVGCGNVGGIVRDWGKLMGAEVLVNDPPKQKDGIPGDYVDLDTLLGVSDAVTLHTPLTTGGDFPTRHLIGERELSLMRRGAIIVNAARGPVVDFKALGHELKSGRIRAIIDTWESEPEVDMDVLENAIYGTFHIAGYSRQGKERATRMVLEAVEREFGVTVDKTGLEKAYYGTPGLNEEMVIESYDPATDSDRLRQSPHDFDTLRRNYAYREET